MASKRRQGVGKAATAGRRASRRRRAAGGGRLAGGTAGQRERAREAEARRLVRTEADEADEAAGRRSAEPPTSLASAVAILAEDALRLLRTFAAAPFRIAGALRRGMLTPAGHQGGARPH